MLVPLLRGLGVARLDMLMLSHRGMDHVGGAASIMLSLPVTELVSPLEVGYPLLSAGPPHRRCVQGERWAWDAVQFELLLPPAAQYEDAKLKSNAMSCVLRASDVAGHSAMLSGDMEAPQERGMVAKYPAMELQSDRLMVPHHGSKTSSTDALLDAVRPKLAVVQAGYRNRFAHPALPILARYQAHGIQLVTSPDCGALTWYSRDEVWQCQRGLARRYWHSPISAQPLVEPMGPQPEVDADMQP